MRSYGFPGFPGPAAAGHAGSQCRAQLGRDGMVAAGELDTVGLSWTLRDMFQRCVALTRRSPGLRTPRGQNTVFTRRGMEKRQVSGHSDGGQWAPCKTAPFGEALAVPLSNPARGL